MKDDHWIILFAVIVVILVVLSTVGLNDKQARCSGLVLDTPSGWVCTNVQKGETR